MCSGNDQKILKNSSNKLFRYDMKNLWYQVLVKVIFTISILNLSKISSF